jgi:hypothetical protein
MDTHLSGPVDEHAQPRSDGTFSFPRSQTANFLVGCGENACDGCTPFFKSVLHGNPGAVLCLLVVLFCVMFSGTILVKDETVDVAAAVATHQHLIPPGALCANQEDMYDDESHLCQLRNTFAYGYLLGHSWVMCAPNMDGAQVTAFPSDM